MKLKIEGMTCGHCKIKVENIIKKFEGVKEVDVDLIEAEAEIDAEKLDLSILKEALAKEGYTLKS